MKNKLAILFLLPITLAGCGSLSSSSSSSSSEVPVFEAYYQAPNQRLTYYDVSRAGEMDSLPAVGNVKLLVIPVIIEGYEENATSEVHDSIQKVMFGQSSDTSWESVASYYYKSSYGKLSLNGEVTPWFASGYSQSYMDNLERRGNDSTSLLLDDAIDWVRDSQPNIDLSEYDNDNDGHLDAVWMIYSAPSQTSDVFWAFVYWNYRNQNNKSTMNPTPFTYAWASYDFMYDGYGSNGIDAHTYIHETGHLLGLDDYYDYDGRSSPMGAIDMMDNNIIDHNGYSKFALGWTNPYIITGDADIQLQPASLSGQSILLSADWNGNPFDEYLLLELYTPDGLNEKDSLTPYPDNGRRGFTIPGVRMYHVDARLYDSSQNEYVDDLSSSNTYIGASNSSSLSYLEKNSTRFKLLSLIDADKKVTYLSNPIAVAYDSSLFVTGDMFDFENYKTAFPFGTKNKMNDETTMPFSIEFSEVNSGFAQLKIRLM